MGAKEMARLMAKRGIKPRTRTRAARTMRTPQQARPGKRLVDAFQEVPEGEAGKVQSVYKVPDSWEPARGMKNPLPPQEEEREGDRRRGPKKKAKHKRRGSAMNFSVSDEEAFLLRKYAHDQGMSFSEWARIALFKAMGKPIPSRE